MSQPHVILIMDGGIIQEAISNVPLDVMVLDYDTDGCEDYIELPRAGYGKRPHVSAYGADVDATQHSELLSKVRERLQLQTQARLEYLRQELRAERISTEELVELQALASHIAKGDVELLEAAGVPEHDDETT